MRRSPSGSQNSRPSSRCSPRSWGCSAAAAKRCWPLPGARARADAGAAALAELAQKIPDASAAVRSELEALANRLTAVERSEKAVASGDRAVRLALAASALTGAVERGEAFAAELATIKTLGGEQKLVAEI